MTSSNFKEERDYEPRDYEGVSFLADCHKHSLGNLEGLWELRFPDNTVPIEIWDEARVDSRLRRMIAKSITENSTYEIDFRGRHKYLGCLSGLVRWWHFSSWGERIGAICSLPFAPLLIAWWLLPFFLAVCVVWVIIVVLGALL